MKLSAQWCFLLLFFTFLIPAAAADNAAEPVLRFSGDRFSAKLRAVPLEKVLQQIGEEKGVWFHCDASQRNVPVSVEFTDLSLEEGMKRILSRHSDYCLFYNGQGKLSGGAIVARGSAVFSSPGSRVCPTGFGVTRNSPPPGGVVTLTPEQAEGFMVRENSPPPGGAHTLETLPEEVRDLFNVRKNCPPGGDCSD